MPGGGGGGGAAVYIPSSSIVSTAAGTAYVGGEGGNGGAPDTATGGGGGGGGGAGLVIGTLTGSLTIETGSTVTGGAGGKGGEAPSLPITWGGGGGGGGDGLLLLTPNTLVTVRSASAVTGGTGGAGGIGTVANGGDGASGAGIRAMGTGLRVTNGGTISGGDSTGSGAAGIGIITQGGASITNSGTLSGGLGATGRASSVLFNGTGNTLTLQTGSSVTGAVELATGASATITAIAATSIDGATLDGGGAQLLLDLTSSSLDLGSGITGSGDVTSSGTGLLTLHAVDLAGSLDLDNSAGVATSGSPIETTGLQHYGGPVVVGGDTSFSSSGGSITFDSSIDGGHAVEVDATTGNASFGGPLGGGAALSALTVKSDTLTIGAVNAGAIDLEISNGIAQGGAFTIAGDSVFRTSGDLTLMNAANAFGGDVQVDAANAHIAAAGDLHVSSLVVAAAGDIELASGGILTLPAGGLSTQGTITLKGTFAPGKLSGTSIDLDETGGLIFADDVIATDDLTLHAGGTIIQSAGTIIAGTVSADAGGNDIVLAQAGNAINGIGDVSAHRLSLANSTALTFAGDVHVDTLDLDVPSGAVITGTVTADTGATILPGTTLTVGDGATSGTLQASVTDNGELAFNCSDTVAFAGALGGSGSLAQQGSGTLLFDGDGSSFQGQTRVEHGALVIGSVAGNNAKLAGDVTVATGALLGGHGRIDGNVTVENAATLSPGASIGTLTVGGDLTMAQGSVLHVELGAPGTQSAPGDGDSVSVAGNLALNGVAVDVTDTGNMGPGVYRLFDYDGTLTETNGGLALGSTPPGSLFQLQTLTGQKQINLIDYQGETLNFWNANGLADATRMGGGSGTWSHTSATWTDESGSVTAAMNPQPAFAVFGGDAGTVTVDTSAGSVSATGLQFASDGYRLTGGTLTLAADAGHPAPVEVRVGDGGADTVSWVATIDSVVSGTDGLRKTGLGTLILSGANAYSGGTEIDGGVLSVAADTGLGDVDGSLSFDGGTLRLGSAFSVAASRAVVLDAGGGTIDTNGFDTTITQVVTGSGGLVKSGAGTLTLAGMNSFTGAVDLVDGTLALSNGGALDKAASFTLSSGTFDIANISGDRTVLRNFDGSGGVIVLGGKTLTVDEAQAAAFAGTLSGTGTFVKSGGASLALTGDNSGFAGLIEVAGGDLSTRAELLGASAQVDTGATLTLDQAADGEFPGRLTGNGGRLIKTGTAALLYNDDGSGFAGTTEVTAGALIVGSDAAHGSAVLGGSVNIADGALLGGHGSVGSGAGSVVSIAAGGILAAGNSIGSLTVNGDLSIAAGARLEVEVDPAGVASDLVHVTGKAAIGGGSVAHIGANGTYQPTSTYTILTADGGVSGRFDSVTSDFAFLNPSLLYDAGDVLLRLDRNDVAFDAKAVTRNQRAVAGTLDTLGLGNPVYGAVVALADDDDTIRGAFDALSGEIHASAKGILIEDSHFLRDAANDRLRAAFGAAGSNDAPALANRQGAAAWARGFGAWADLDSDGNAAKASSSTGGYLTGVDAALGEDLRAGFMAGYSRTKFSVRSRSSSGSSDNWHVGLYAGGRWGALGLRAGAAYTWHDISIERGIAFAGFSNSVSADYGARTAQAFGELAYDLEAGQAALEPFANLAYVNLHTDRFEEVGGAAELSAASANAEVTFTTLGLRASSAIGFGDTTATLRGTLGWRHAFGDTTPTADLAFGASDAFTVAGAPLGKDAAVVEAGLNFVLSRKATFGLAYQGQFASGAQQNGFNATIEVRF